MTMDDYAKKYYKKHGTLLLLNKKYIHYKPLKQHLAQLRKQYENGTLPSDKKEMYDKMGMVWNSDEVEHAKWEYCYNLAKQYYSMFGTLDMPKAFEMNGVALNTWLVAQIDAHKSNELSLRRVEKMEAIGVKWNKKNVDRISFPEKSIAYYVEKVFPDTISSYRPAALNGKELDIYIPSLNIGIEYDGGAFHNGSNVQEKDAMKNRLCAAASIHLIRVRDKAALPMASDENCTVIHRHSESHADLQQTIKTVLQTLGVSDKDMPDFNLKRDQYNIFNDMVEEKTYFNQYLMAAKHYYRENGHLFVPKKYEDPTGLKLGKWITTMRDSKQYLSEQQINALDEVGMVWNNLDQEKWLYNFHLVNQCETITEEDVTCTGSSLQSWLDKQLDAYDNYEIYEDYKIEAIQKYIEKQNTREEVSKDEKPSVDKKARKADDLEL